MVGLVIREDEWRRKGGKSEVVTRVDKASRMEGKKYKEHHDLQVFQVFLVFQTE